MFISKPKPSGTNRRPGEVVMHEEYKPLVLLAHARRIINFRQTKMKFNSLRDKAHPFGK